MKIRLPRQEFQDALTAIATITGGRTTKPILSCVRLSANGDSVELSATDGETALRLKVAALSVERPGVAVMAADRLLSIIREMVDAEISLDADERACMIRGAGSEFKIFVMNPADFPPVPEFEDEPDLVIDGVQLRRMIGLTLYAAARETSRYAINGVLWEKQGKKMFLVATDGRRLARAGGSLQESRAADFQAIVPTKAMNVFERVFLPAKEGEEWLLDIKMMPNQMLLRYADKVLSTVLIEGHFPKYQDVIPKGNDKRVRLNRNEFHGAIRRAALLTTEDSRAVRFSFDRQRLEITANSPEQGEARVEMAADYDGPALDIGFNPAFLTDALKVVPHSEVFFELQESFRPGILCGEDKNEFLYVIMPVSLSS